MSTTTMTIKPATLTTRSNPIVDFTTISFAKISKGDKSELASLLRACEQDGFLYLDLQGSPGVASSAAQDVTGVFQAAEKFFELESEEKIKHDVDVIGPWKLNGYTPFGRNAGLAGTGKKHGVEGYTFPRDGICNLVKDPQRFCHLPRVLQEKRTFLANFMNQLHEVGLTLLGALDQVTADNPKYGNNTSLASKHKVSNPSTTCLTVQRYPSLSAESPNTGLSAHTDVGSLTILFCQDRGLQVLHPDTNQWQYVEPKAGCAVVNIGDSLRFLSNKRLRSVMHRVVSCPGTTIQNRFSCAYFIRPNLDAEFRDEDGKSWKSIDWHIRKYRAYREMGKRA